MGIASVPLQAATFTTISPRDTGRASSLYSTTRQVGSSISVAILATTLASRTATPRQQPPPQQGAPTCSTATAQTQREDRRPRRQECTESSLE
jgi:hypothetical protein